MAEIIVLGADGGGTSTRVVLADHDGTVLGYGRAGPSSLDGVDLETTTRHIGEAVDSAWQDSGLRPRPVDASFWGIAGVASERDRDLIRGVVLAGRVSDPHHVGIDHDIRIALAGGLGNRPGIVLIAGTGSSCYGRASTGASVRVGGWGHVLDDGGSSYFLGLEAVKAVVRSADGRRGPTSLTDAVLSRYGIADVQEIMHELYATRSGKSDLAALAPVVLAAAEDGDEAARNIVEAAFEELAGLVSVACSRLALGSAERRLTVTGGLAHSGAYFRDGLYRAVAAKVPGIQVQEPLLPPVLGAVLLALELLDPPSAARALPALLRAGQAVT